MNIAAAMNVTRASWAAIAIAFSLLAGCDRSSHVSADADADVTADVADVAKSAAAPTSDDAATAITSLPPVDASRKYSDDAFRRAAHDGNIDIVRGAIATGTRVDAVDPDGKFTALLLAAYNGHSHVVRELLNHGAAVDSRDADGKTPLIHAASGPFPETVTMLIDAGADVNAAESTEGFTALMTAAALGEVEVIRILLARGADPTLRDADNDTAKDYAKNAGKFQAVNALP